MTAPVIGQRGLLAELDALISEERNPNTMDIDVLPTLDLVRTINREDALVAAAIEKVLPEVSAAVDRIVAAFEQGGRLIYLGAGTSGRLGVLDAAECLPTFGVPEGMVIGLIAGGPAALVNAVEGAEDDAEAGADDLRRIELGPRDVVVGIAVSGRTPYVLGGLAYARAVGATTVALSCNLDSAIAAQADIAISPIVGPEVLTGSTRLKSGTAQKLVLNMLTTASMIRIGKAYQNLMVDVRPSNEKLVARAIRIIMQATGCTAAAADTALTAAANDVKLAILLVVAGVSAAEGRARLAASRGFLRAALGQSAPEARRN